MKVDMCGSGGRMTCYLPACERLVPEGTAGALRAKGSVHRPIETRQKFIRECCGVVESVV